MNWNITETPAMELRDSFAIQILNGLLSSYRSVPYQALVRDAYEIADMMIEQRNKKGNE